MSKKILIQIPDTAAETMEKLHEEMPHLNQTRLIRMLLSLLEGLSPKCSILAFDETHLRCYPRLSDRIVKCSDPEAPIRSENIDSFSMEINLKDGKVTKTGSYVELLDESGLVKEEETM